MDAMLVTLAEKLGRSLGEVAHNERWGNLSAPLTNWTGRDFVEYVRRLRRATRDEHLGLGTSPCRLGTSDFMIELGARTVTLGDALDCWSRFMALTTSSVALTVEIQDVSAALTIHQAASLNDPEFALSDWLMIVLHKLPQFLLRCELPLQRAEFTHSMQGQYSDYTIMFGSECLFNLAKSRLIFNRSMLHKPIIATVAEARELIANKRGYFSRPVGIATTWSQSVKSILLSEMRHCGPLSSLEQIADSFEICGQTLRRRLRDEGTSYRKLKQDVRHEIALNVLAQKDATVAEASYAAGFADATALTRALKTTRGISSQQLREQVGQWKQPRFGQLADVC
jgi:AraC-like DNA-binding protein